MDDDVGVKKLLELIFVKKFQITAEMTAPDSPIPACLLINDFPLKLRRVLWARQVIITLKWSQGGETCAWHLLTTHETYLENVIYGCLNERYCQQNVFESFISVCSFVRYFSEETFKKSGMNFSDLNFDIMMELYESDFKNSFLKCGGFQRLVKYIHQHKYIKWNLDMDDIADSSTPPNVEAEKKLKKVSKEEDNVLKSINPDQITMMVTAASLAKKVLSRPSFELPTLPSDQNSNRTVDASGSNDKATTAEADLKFEPLEEFNRRCSNSDSKTNRLAKQKKDIARCESVVQAVMRHNQSRTLGLVTSDNSLQKKADGILEHLKDAIESLIDVLDEYDKE